MSDRPIDVLNEAKGKRVLVKLKRKRDISGILKALDLHLNMWLEDAESEIEDGREKLGSIFIRGDNVLYVAPAEQ